VLQGPKINIVEQNFRVPKDAEFYAESKFVEKVEKSQAQLVRYVDPTNNLISQLPSPG
jgi:hypothetical protein